MNNVNPINSLFSGGGSHATSGLFGSPVNFGNTFDQAMTQARTPADKAKVAFIQAKFTQQNILASMFSDPHTSMLGFGANELFGTGGPFGLASWVYDAQRVLGNNSDVSKLIGLGEQAAFLAQSNFNHQLSSLGSTRSTGGGINSLF